MDTNKKGLIGRIRSLGWGFAAMLFIAGVLFWGGFNTAMEWTNREEFCISCHEMKDNVYQEYRNTIHASNRSGVRATCPDCHVPKEWGPKMIRKIQASNEVLHKVLGTIDTPEKFNAKRLELAKHEWDRMKKTDSRECRNCHNFGSFDYAEQGRRSSKMHQTGLNEGKRGRRLRVCGPGPWGVGGPHLRPVCFVTRRGGAQAAGARRRKLSMKSTSFSTAACCRPL